MTGYQQFIRFAIVGAIGFAVDVGVLYLNLHLGMGYFIGRAISFLCAVWVTWKINRQFTFISSGEGSDFKEMLRYLAAMLFGGLINYLAYLIVVMQVRNLPFLPFFAVAIGSVSGMMFNYFTAKSWVFKSVEKLKNKK
ncbi:GtrA family protein [Collimonas silvisoli]|uniref:GtrA family protein n=1 Tax=Collimonas silvisoli TaxID=2825884 RepID=UPI001B8C6B0D|nr:GtrA family protein [Collimonas silvisoli]